MTAENRVTFFSKNKIVCPVCAASFYREDLLTGRGRLIAGEVTDELRRLYDPSDKYGRVHPLIYPVTVCPSCYYSAYSHDFPSLADDVKKKIEKDVDRRLQAISLLFEELDFGEPRTLKEGIASYYFAILCYELFPEEASPTIKQGLSALRAAWLSGDLDAEHPGENYDELARLFYRKARFFYGLAIEYEQNGKERIAGATHLGPDLDKNYGYDGVLYLSAYLDLHYGPRDDEQKREASLKVARRTVSRLFGMGKASKSKPSPILDRSRRLYERLSEELDESDGDGEP